MPSFHIDFSGPKWELLSFESETGKFMQTECFIGELESMHWVSDNDKFQLNSLNYTVFEAPVTVKHKWGHRPAKDLDDQNFEVACAFMTRQFKKKYP